MIKVLPVNDPDMCTVCKARPETMHIFKIVLGNFYSHMCKNCLHHLAIEIIQEMKEDQ